MLRLEVLLLSTLGSCAFGAQAPVNYKFEAVVVSSIFRLWGDLPEDVKTKIREYEDFDRLKYVRIMTLLSFDSFLTEYMQLTRLGSKEGAIDSFYKHKSRQLGDVLSRPGMNSEEFLTALWTNKPIADSEDLRDLREICDAYLDVLRMVNEKIAEFVASGSGVLDFRDSGITDLSLIAGLTRLELYLQGTPVTDLSPLAGLTRLEQLSLRGTPVTDLSPLAGLTGLWWLDLSETPVTDVSPLAGLIGLRWLYLKGTQANPAVLAHLTELTISF